jgi:aryl-alcohol dehydrogenase-like predicted oxidoreductase
VEDVPPGRRHTRFYSGDRPAATRHTDPGQEELTFATIDRLREICDGIGESMTHVALAWLLHKALVTSVLVGVRNPSQVRDNAQAAQVELSRDILAQLDESTEELKQALGTNPDMYQTEGRFR